MKAMMLGGMLSCIVTSSWAAEKPDKPKPAEPVPAVQAPKPEPEASASTRPLTADEVIGKLEQADADLKSLHCRYTQALKIPLYGVDQAGEGELWFQKERKIRIEQRKPRQQTVVSDGNSIWIYNPEVNQVVEQNWAAFEKAQMVSRGLVQFGSYGKLRERYEVSVSTPAAGQGALYRISLTPKDKKDMPFHLEIAVAPPDFLPVQTRFRLNDMEVTTILVDVAVNPELEEKTFVFEPPKGATILKTGLP